jgi:hypothetical protein
MHKHKSSGLTAVCMQVSKGVLNLLNLLISQAKRIQVHQSGILAAGVLGDIVAR